MNNQQKPSIELWMIALGIIGVGFLISFFIPETRSSSPSIAYQEGMLMVLAGCVRLVGSILLLVSIAMVVIRSRRNTKKCPKCGAIPPSKSDRFCRTCGEPISA